MRKLTVSVVGACVVLAVAGLGCGADPSADSGGRGLSNSVAGTGGLGGSGGTAGLGGSGGTFGGQPMQPVTPVAGMSGGTAGTSANPDECSAVTQTAEVELGPVDIVWAIDTSGSMFDEVAAVQANVTNFANMISSAGIDHHVIMVAASDVAASTPLGADPAHYLFTLANVDSHNALQVLMDLYPTYSSFLRPNAPLHFVVVTDDESSVPATTFQTQMQMISGKQFFFHSVASPDSPGPCVGACGIPFVCGAFAAGIQYYALSDATMGQKISVCTADWSQVFGPLQDAVVASVPLPCDYPIPPPPAGETLDPELVNMELIAPGAASPTVFPRADAEAACGTNIAWFYDNPAAPTVLRLCPAACDQAQGGGTVNISFGCDSVPLIVD